MYRKPRLARASSPGSNAFTPAPSARSRSRVPTTRSSVAPSGRSTTGTGFFSDFLRGPGMLAQCGQDSAGLSGSQLYGQPTTARIGGSRAASARIAVDLPVPRSPKTSTPPTAGSTAAISSAWRISSWPTMAEKGKVGTR